MGAYGTNATYGQSAYKDVVTAAMGTKTLPSPVDGDFTLSGWFKTFDSGLPIYLWRIGDLRVFLWNNGGTITLRCYDGTNTPLDCALSADGTGWVNIVVVRSGTTITCYENASSVGSATWTAEDYGTSLSIVDSSTIKCFDLRLVDTGLSAAAIEAYYNDVINNEGNEYCPRW